MKLVGICQYDGSSFSGFQSQKNASSIQDALESAISSVGKLEERINYSGRTDAGVHAIGQVFDFISLDHRELDQWLKGINSALPDSISVVSLQEASENFHSRFDAVNRTYVYTIYTGKIRPVFLQDYVLWEPNILDIDAMRAEAIHLEGTHNFSAFRGSKCTANNPNRTINSIQIIKQDSFLMIQIEANAYLYNMVRIIVGTLLDVATGIIKESVAEILNSQDRTRAGKTAQSQGLFFLGASYNKMELTEPIDSNYFFKFLTLFK